MKNFYIAQRHKIAYSVFVLFYIWLRLLHVSKIIAPKTYPDSSVYLSVAKISIFSPEFWLARVPVVIPTIYKILGSNLERIVDFQTGLSIFAWILLGLASTVFFRGKLLKIYSFVFVLFFSLSTEILLFDQLILSESISLSLMVIHLSLWMFLIANKFNNWWLAIFVIVSGVLWVYTRDTNALLMLGTAGLLLLLSFIIKKSLKLKVISLSLIGMCILSSQLGSASERWLPPNLKVVEQRILTDQESLEFYIDQGMPVNETLMSFAGRRSGRIADWFENPELEDFVEWHNENGKQVYLRYLLRDPIEFFLGPIKNITFMVNANPLSYYMPDGFEPIFPAGLNNLVFFKYWTLYSKIYTAFLLLAGVVVYIYKRKEMLIVPLSMSLLLYPHALIVWTASGGDVNRHSYQFRVQFRLALWLILIFLLGFLIEEIVKRFYSDLESGKRLILGLGGLLVIFSYYYD